MVKLARSVRPPVWAAVLATLWGGSAAAAFAELIASVTRDRIADALGPSGQAWTSALAAPLPEEVVKAVGVVLLMMAATPALRNPLLGMTPWGAGGDRFQCGRRTRLQRLGNDKIGVMGPVVVRSARSRDPHRSHHPCRAERHRRCRRRIFLRRGGRRLTRRSGVLVGLLVAAVVLHTLIDTPLLDEWGVGGVIVKQIPVAVAVWVLRAQRDRSIFDFNA